jgi:uncharacterized RDD family membrane protein YckC
MTDLDSNRFAPPKADLAEPATLAGAPVLAGRGTRFVAVILDGVLNMLIFLPVYLLLGGSSMWSFDPQTPPDPFAMMGSMIRASIPGYIAIALIQGWSLHAFGGTLGKKLLGLRIVRTDGSRAGFVRLFFGRGAVAVLPPIIPFLGALFVLLDVLLIFRESRQCLHDQIADTLVIAVPPPAPAALAVPRA